LETIFRRTRRCGPAVARQVFAATIYPEVRGASQGRRRRISRKTRWRSKSKSARTQPRKEAAVEAIRRREYGAPHGVQRASYSASPGLKVEATK
jgi:hypothetical protein